MLKLFLICNKLINACTKLKITHIIQSVYKFVFISLKKNVIGKRIYLLEININTK